MFSSTNKSVIAINLEDKNEPQNFIFFFVRELSTCPIGLRIILRKLVGKSFDYFEQLQKFLKFLP